MQLDIFNTYAIYSTYPKTGIRSMDTKVFSENEIPTMTKVIDMLKANNYPMAEIKIEKIK